MRVRAWTLVALGWLLFSTGACSSDSPPAGNPGDGRPPAPWGLSLQEQGYNTFQLQWEAPLGPVDGFLVEGRVDAEVVPFQEWPGGRTTAGQLETIITLDNTMPELIPLAFRVRSFIGDQLSEPTNTEIFGTPLWPPADAAVLSGDAGVDLSWSAGSYRADRILIERLTSLDAGTAERAWTLPPISGHLFDGDVVVGTRYWFRFRSAMRDVTSPAIDVGVMVE